MSLIQDLPPGPLDIVGDIHGEIDALHSLLAHLGYDAQGRHPDGRTLVFVGDFCDRGPDSPAVLARVAHLVASGRAVAVIGNHEINLLRNDAKDGAGWYFDARLASDHDKYAPFARPTASQRAAIVAFLGTLPVALERPDLRIVHAAWLPAQIAAVRPAGIAGRGACRPCAPASVRRPSSPRKRRCGAGRARQRAACGQTGLPLRVSGRPGHRVWARRGAASSGPSPPGWRRCSCPTMPCARQSAIFRPHEKGRCPGVRPPR